MMDTHSMYNEYNLTGPTFMPSDWQIVRLGDVVQEITSGDWGQQNAADGFVKCRVIRGTDFPHVENGLLVDVPVRFLKIRSFSRHKLNAGDLLVEISGGSKAQPTGRMLLISERTSEQVDMPITFSNFVKRLRVSPLVDPAFYRLYWENLYRNGGTRTYEKRTTGIYNFKLDEFLKAEALLLPPLPEQKKIAAVLSAVQETKEKSGAVIRATRELKKSLMKHLFTYGPVPLEEAENVPLKETEIGLVPEEWEVVRLGDVVRTQYGYTASACDNNVGPQFLRITDIDDDGNVNWSAVPYCVISSEDYRKFCLDDGDTVVARIGATTGKAYSVRNPPLSVFASYLIRLKVQDKDKLQPAFVGAFTKSALYWTQVNQNKGGKLKTGLSATQLEQMEIPVPPLQIQQRITIALSAIEKKLETEENKKKALEELFRTLLNNLMTGRMRVSQAEVEA